MNAMLTISEAIAIALQSYQTGNLSQAELICHQILQQQPNYPEALHLLGVIAHQVGKLQEAIFYYQQTLALGPDRADAYYNLGYALQQQGDLSAAIVYYQQAIALEPDYTDAYYNLGYALQQQGDLSAAIVYYQQAIALNPNDAEAHGNLAYALQQQGQIEAAIAHYQQVIALRPDVPEIYYNLGNLFRQQDQLEAAITHYQWALALNPNYGDAYFQLGASLHSSGQIEEAIVCYQQAISLVPNFPDAYYNLGNALREQGQYEEALIQYQQALAVEPNFPDAYVGISYLLYQSQLEAAIVCLQQAVMLNPNHAEAYHNLGIAFAAQNKLDEAIGYLQKALQLKPDFVAAYLQSQLILPILYDTQQQILSWRQRFCRGLNNLIQQTALETSESRKQVLKGLARIATTFYLGYQGLNDRGLQRKYGTFIHRVMAANYPQLVSPLPMPPLSNTGKIRVGYLSAHFKEHTTARLTQGWLKNCDKQQFEIYSYYIGHQADSTTEQFRSCSDYFYHIYGSLKAVCQQVIADKLHILVFTDIGMEPGTTYIAALRLAPVQCMTWVHPITSGLPTIDYFLSSDLMEPENAQAHYSEKLVRLPNISVCYEKPSLPELRKTRSDFQLREDAVIYLSCQSLFKYLPQFDYIFAKIAQRVPQAQFVFLSHPATTVNAQFQARLEHAFASLGLHSEDYCVFLPRLERVDYFNLNLVSDIFLDTFSWSGGNTTLEAIACGLPVVTCPGEFMRSRHAYGILKMMGACETIAQDEAEYVEIAVRLGLDADWRQDIVRKIYECHSWLYDDRTCVAALEFFYKSVFLQQFGNSQQAIARQSDVPEIYYNLGNIFKQQGQLEVAITHPKRALALNPNYVDAYLQLGASLHSCGQHQEAIICFQQAIYLKPNIPDAYYNLGNALLEGGRYSEAIIQYRQALALEPDSPDTHLQLGWALMHLNQFEEATACLQQAVILNPDHPEAYQKLGLALADQNKLDEAIGCLQKALQLKPDLVTAYWQSQLILPILYDTQQEILSWRQRFCRRLNDLIQQTALDTPEGIKDALTGLTGAAITFKLGYQGFNDRGVQRKYGKFVHQVISAICPQWASPLPMPLLSNTDKIRVGYLSANFRSQTVAFLTFGWLKHCDRQKFEIYSYYIGYKADVITEQFRSCSDSFHHIYDSLEAICQQVIADKLHILVFPDIGMYPLTTYIAALRLAPVQCMAWGHPITSGLPTIDYFLSSELMEPENAQAHYSEKLVRLPNISICYQKPSVPEPKKTRSDFQLREDAVIYLSCQSLIKYLPQFDYIFAQIAQRVPQAQFAFISSQANAITGQFQSRLQRAFANLNLNSEDYCVVLPRLQAIDYFNLNSLSDIFLDTFSWSGGNTTLEAIGCGLPVVTCPGEFMRSRHAYGILKMMGVKETIAQDESEYVEIAVRLGLDADWRQDIVGKIYERHSWLYDDRTCVTALESFYKSVVQQDASR